MNIMVDIETLSTEPNACILSIGAVRFDEEGLIYCEFYKNIIPQNNRHIDVDTVEWWFNYPEAYSELKKDRWYLKEALYSLGRFICKGDMVWAKSPSFDLAILKNAYKEYGIVIPWDFRNERDVRTAEKRKVESVGTKHNALDDCYTQIKSII